ncbi:MAG: ABC transporter permease subunit [Geminicoccaceae bacterium]
MTPAAERPYAAEPVQPPLLRLAALPRATLISLLTCVVLFVAWWLAARVAMVSPVFLPSPQAVAAKAVQIWNEGYVDASLGAHLLASLQRIVGAFLLGIAVGVPVGLAMGLTTVGRGIFDPIAELIRPIPPLAYLPLVVIWCGIGEGSKILVMAIAMFAPIALTTAAAVAGVAPHRIDAARSLGASRLQTLLLVVLPSALPEILVGARIALGVGCSTLVAAELVAATRGLGFMIQSAANFLQTEVVIVGILVIAAVAFALDGLLRLLERLLTPWRGRM